MGLPWPQTAYTYGIVAKGHNNLKPESPKHIYVQKLKDFQALIHFTLRPARNSFLKHAKLDHWLHILQISQVIITDILPAWLDFFPGLRFFLLYEDAFLQQFFLSFKFDNHLSKALFVKLNNH